MLLPLIFGLLCLQEPTPEPKGQEPAPQPEVQAKEGEKAKPAAVPIEAWDDRRGKAEAKTLKAAFKGKPSMRDRSKALDVVAPGANKYLVKPLQDIVDDDDSLVIRRRAAELLGNQPEKEANKAIRKLLASAKVAAAPTVQAELIRSLSRCGYEDKHWKGLAGEFERLYHLDRVPVQEAMLDLVIAHKEKQAIPVLLRNLDEPIPADPHAAGNPPAEYWEARWKSWRIWRGKVKEALFVITGQRFSTANEARAWLRKNKLE